ncbi:hypothetical protein LTR10_017278 [Elasticomyces elasticus]|uniref:Uncharacterized protein n=1 Tax=Exophiala sideris TaxID=1016849 RepID=A0ABR0JHW5_9EURO|nr:hypothetical protein LTR10_017278 [Elasticomyces elasticus]KAK5034162.1 hypothetical protein LTS07_003082 [Exophiala sideris]KAK5042458.1 hypothetical protein LTR13_001305 [Exophiala sideris]KAK5065540.1 hypothetical protein LTR69_003089 [Exophiala sideris]KAK5186002.1 hypothetical protein LTR44_002051 [Eurotiomycetes sp. CCFEE 6388]
MSSNVQVSSEFFMIESPRSHLRSDASLHREVFPAAVLDKEVYFPAKLEFCPGVNQNDALLLVHFTTKAARDAKANEDADVSGALILSNMAMYMPRDDNIAREAYQAKYRPPIKNRAGVPKAPSRRNHDHKPAIGSKLCLARGPSDTEDEEN